MVQTTTLSANISDPPQSTQHSGSITCLVGLRRECSAKRSCSSSDDSHVFSDSPVSKPCAIETENQFSVVKTDSDYDKGALLLSKDETACDNSSGSELDFISNDAVRPLSPVERPDESEKFEQGDRKSLMENQIAHSKENERVISEKELDEKNSSLDCSPRISLNVNRLLSLKVKQ